MKTSRIGSLGSYAAAFLFCAAALSACGGEEQCWKDTHAGTTYHVTLAAPSLGDSARGGGLSGSPSCAGLDNLSAGGSLDVAIPSNPQHVVLTPSSCWAAQGDVTSDIGLTLVGRDVVLYWVDHGQLPMFFSSARFSTAGCDGTWNFIAAVGLDPRTNTHDYRWGRRTVKLDSTAACQAAYPDVAPVCNDDWDIDVQPK